MPDIPGPMDVHAVVAHLLQPVLPTTGHYEIGDEVLSLVNWVHPIDITISLKPSPTQKPARLQLQTISKPITVKYCPSSGGITAQDRVLETEIVSETGSINATLPHWYSTTMQSQAGNVTADLYPHGLTSEKSEIILKLVGGSSENLRKLLVTVHPHVIDRKVLLVNLNTRCFATRADLKLVYPLTWRGTILTKGQRGHVKVTFDKELINKKGHFYSLNRSVTVGDGEGCIRVDGFLFSDLNVEILGQHFAEEDESHWGTSCGEGSRLPSQNRR